MAKDNRVWGSERIQSELLKLGTRVFKRTIQKYTRPVGATTLSGRTWAIFLKSNAPNIWACDFLPVVDLAFRPLFLFFLHRAGERWRSPERAKCERVE